MSASGYLERIERYGSHVVNDARSVASAVKAMPSRPGFETNAEEALRNAEKELNSSLTVIRRALKNYTTKPVTA